MSLQPLHGTGALPPETVETTTHTVSQSSGSAQTITVDHAFYEAIKFDFYIPEQIRNNAAIEELIRTIDSLGEGATIYPQLTGIWMGQPEGVQIYSVVLRRDRFDLEHVRNGLRRAQRRTSSKRSCTWKRK